MPAWAAAQPVSAPPDAAQCGPDERSNPPGGRSGAGGASCGDPGGSPSSGHDADDRGAKPSANKPSGDARSKGAPSRGAASKSASKGDPAKSDPAKSDPSKGRAEGAIEVKKGRDGADRDDRSVSRGATAIIDVAAGLDEALPPLEGRVVVGVAPLAADVAAPRGKALSVTIARVFAGRRHFEPPTDAETLDAVRARAGSVRAIVYLTPRVANGELVVTADAFRVPRTVWARIRNPAPGPFAHAFAKSFIDAEIRSHLEPVPMTAFDATRGKNFESGVLALACDDLDRDGAPEILSLSRKSVTLSRIRGGRVEPLASRLWSDLSSVAPAPLREPIGLLATARVGRDPLAPRAVVAAITDRASAVELDADLALVDAYGAMAVPDGDAFACARLAAITVTGPLVACRSGAASPSRPSVGGRYDAFASARLVTADGKPFEVSAGREDGTLEVFDDAGHKITIPHVGAQVAVGDVDQDGSPEIFTSLDVARGATDALVVYSWSRADAKVREIVRMPIAAGVQAIATCPPESAKRAPFILATADEIVVLR